MSIVRLARPWPAAILAIVGIAAQSAAQTSPSDPDAVFKKAGLQRSGNSLVLDSETEAYKLEKSIAQLQTKVQQEQVRQQQAQMLISQAQQLRMQANSVRPQGRAPRGARAATNNQYNALINQAQQLEQQARQQTGGNNNAALTRDTKQLQDDLERYQNLVNRTKKAYEELYRQKDMVEALRKLNHLAQPKVALGPIPQYIPNVARQCADELVDMGLTHAKNLFYPTDEDKLAQEISELALRHRKSAKANEPEPRLRAEVAEYRGRAEEADAKRDQLAGEEVVKDLLAEVQKAQKARIRIGASPKLQRALNDLESIEKDLEQSKP